MNDKYLTAGKNNTFRLSLNSHLFAQFRSQVSCLVVSPAECHVIIIGSQEYLRAFPDVLVEAYKFCNKPGIFNSVSGEGDKIDKIFPEMVKPGNEKWQVIALLSDDTGIPKCAADRLKVFDKIMAKAKEYGIAPNRIHIDPLVEMLCTSEDGIAMNIEVISTIRKQYPTIHITAAVSNISFNLPVRKLVNYGFTVLAMNYGLDSGILDPCNRDMMGLIYATEALLGQDDYCMEYITAYREGRIGPVKK